MIWNVNHFEVIDVSNPMNPIVKGYYLLPSGGTACTSYNNYILVGTSEAGLLALQYYGEMIEEKQKSPPFNKIKVVLQNPIKNGLKLKYFVRNKTGVNIKIIDVSGEICYNITRKMGPGWHEEEIDFSRIPQGVYFVCLYTEEDKWVKKIVYAK